MKENNKTISEQEIKEAIKEITNEPNEEYVEKIKVFFEFNPWLLEKLTDEQLKEDYIKRLYNYEYLYENNFKYLKENEILGKMVLEIILKYSKKSYPSEVKSDSEIFSLLSGADWKEKSEFYVIDEDEVGWKGVHNYRAKPQKVVENYCWKQDEKWEERSKRRLEKKERKIEALEKILREEDDRNKQISLLNKLYKDGVEELEYEINSYNREIEKYKEKGLNDLVVLNIYKEKIEELTKELEKVKLKEEQNNQLIAQIEVKK